MSFFLIGWKSIGLLVLETLWTQSWGVCFEERKTTPFGFRWRCTSGAEYHPRRWVNRDIENDDFQALIGLIEENVGSTS